MEALKKVGNYVKEHPKVIIYSAVTIAGIVALVIVYNNIKKALGQKTEKVDKHDYIGSNITITKDDAKSIADRLWDNVLNYELIVSFKDLKAVFDDYPNINNADKTMVYNAFGIRNNGFPFYIKGDLWYWIDRKVKFGRGDCDAFFAGM
jgi:hypothetical protein